LNRSRQLIALAACLFVGTFVWSQCSSKPEAPPPPAAAKTTPGLIGGEMTPVVSVRELMKYMIDPLADNMFDAVWWETGKDGKIIEHSPKTDEDWEKIRVGAVTVAEGVFLLKVPRPFTPPGDVNNSTGPNPPELSPTQIKEKVEKDPVLWEAKIQALRNVGLEVLEIVKKKDTSALFQASGDLDEACEGCHLEYWYPGDKKAVDEIKNARVTFDKPAKGK